MLALIHSHVCQLGQWNQRSGLCGASDQDSLGINILFTPSTRFVVKMLGLECVTLLFESYLIVSLG